MAGMNGYHDDLKKLYARVNEASPGLFADENAFLSFVEQSYGKENRFFHGVRHLLNMTAQSTAFKEEPKADDTLYEKWAKDYYPAWAEKSYTQLFSYIDSAYQTPLSEDDKRFMHQVNLLAAVCHDTEYHVDGSVTDHGRELLSHYINLDEKGAPVSVKSPAEGFPSEQEDKVAHIVLDLFSQEEGKPLNPFVGQNELLSALTAAKRMEASGADIETIVGVVAGIEATWPFKKHDDYLRLQERLDIVYTTNETLKARYPEQNTRNRRVDMVNGAATLLANQDVIGFLGGLEPNQKPDFTSVSHSMSDNQFLVTEEGPKTLHQSTVPGDFSTYDILAPTFKRVRLNEFLLQPGHNNLFHSVTIRGDGVSGITNIHYPPYGDMMAMNAQVRALPGRPPGNGDIINDIFKARVGALALVHAVGLAIDTPEKRAARGDTDIKLADLVDGMSRDPNYPWITKRPNIEDHVQLAVNILDNRPSGSEKVDVRHSPLASTLLQGISLEGVHRLYKAAEDSFGKQPGDKEAGKAFLDKAVDIIGRQNVQSLLGAVARARQGKKDFTTAALIEGASKDVKQELS